MSFWKQHLYLDSMLERLKAQEKATGAESGGMVTGAGSAPSPRMVSLREAASFVG